MGLFSNKDEKANELIEKYHLDGMSADISAQLIEIAQELAGTGAMETGMKLSMAKAEEQLKISYLNAIMKQNWIIIKLLDEIAHK